MITKLFQMVSNSMIRRENSFLNSITSITNIIFAYKFILKRKEKKIITIIIIIIIIIIISFSKVL